MIGIAVIRGDWNDGDYVSETIEFDTNEELEKFKRAIKLVNKVFDGEDLHNSIENAIDDNDDLSDSDKELLDWVSDCFPYGYEGLSIHSYDVVLYIGNDIKRQII